MIKHASPLASLAHIFRIPSSSSTPRYFAPNAFSPAHLSPFSTTAPMQKRKGRIAKDRRVTMIRYSLHHSYKYTPRPLRLSRDRTLRHWTIQRAWTIFSAKERQKRELELERQYNAMRAACEELRIGAGDDGRLYRQAMMKKGYWGGRSDLGLIKDAEGNVISGEKGRVERGREAGVPIEYGRGLTDGPPRGGFDENWKR